MCMNIYFNQNNSASCQFYYTVHRSTLYLTYLTLTFILTPTMTLNLKINIGNGFFGFKLCGKVVLLAVLVQIVSELLSIFGEYFA